MKPRKSTRGKNIPEETKIAGILTKKKKTLALAESCTGGLVSHTLTGIPGSSKYFNGGVIAYSNDVKTSVLSVPSKIIREHGAVSRRAALAMAEGAKRVLRSDIAAAVTGIAGPSGGSEQKPVGTAYIAFVDGKVRKSRKVVFKGDRAALVSKFSRAVLKLILKNIRVR